MVARSTPVGLMLEDGYSTMIAFTIDPDISFSEKTVQPPGLDIGEAIEQTTMHNVTVRTFAARSLFSATEVVIVAAYDPVVYNQIIAVKGVNGLITCHYPNGDTLDFYGFLRNFIPQTHSEGAQPEANIAITPTNVNSDTGAEHVPNYTTAAGTDV